METVFTKAKPTVVVHLAAQAGVRYSIDNPRAYIESNIIGFFNVLEAVRNHPVEHFLYASSSSVYGNREQTPVFDSGSRGQADFTLRGDEEGGGTNCLPIPIRIFMTSPRRGLRFFTVYGPFGRPDMAYFKFTKAICEGKPIDVYNNGNMLRDFTYVDDVTACVEADALFAAEAGRNRRAKRGL